MKVLIVVVAFASCVAASHLPSYGHGAAVANTGSSSQFRSEDNYGNYQFGYDESHAYGSSGRREERHGDVVRGSYRLGDADGRQRTVNYEADNYGFRATVHTNEPGVDPARDPADVLINKEGHAVAAAPAYAAPAPVALVAPAPIAAGPVYSAPAPLAVATQTYGAPAPIAVPVRAYESAAPVYEAQTPRAFSYNFGSSHPSYAHAAPAPVYAAPEPIAAPVYQQNLRY